MHADQTSIEISINKETNISKIIHILDNFTNKQDNNENQTRVIIHSQQIHIETENSGDIQCRLKELTNHAKSGCDLVSKKLIFESNYLDLGVFKPSTMPSQYFCLGLLVSAARVQQLQYYNDTAFEEYL